MAGSLINRVGGASRPRPPAPPYVRGVYGGFSQPVRGVQIPKPGGGQRQLGIPVAVDRLVQQAILQVLNPLLDPTFSNSSYGFRPGRDAHMALEQARKYDALRH